MRSEGRVQPTRNSQYHFSKKKSAIGVRNENGVGEPKRSIHRLPKITSNQACNRQALKRKSTPSNTVVAWTVRWMYSKYPHNSGNLPPFPEPTRLPMVDFRKPLFDPGSCVATPAAVDANGSSGQVYRWPAETRIRYRRSSIRGQRGRG